MKFFHLKRTRSRVHHTQRYPLYGALALLLIALLMLVFVWVQKDRAQNQIARARENLITGIHTDLTHAIRAYEKVSLPTADLSGDILPDMQIHLYSARMGNRIMLETYKENVVEEELLDQIDDAIGQVNHMLALGQSTSSAVNALGSCLNQLEENLNARFADNGLQLSMTALK